jgi:hypothetical protein
VRWVYSFLLLLLLTSPVLADGEVFVDIAEKSGLDFVHWNGMTGERYFVEMAGQGGAFLDYDNDGDLDVYLVQGAKLGKKAPLEPFVGTPRDRLFRNDLEVSEDGRRTLRFTDVTAASGLQATGYGMGVVAGDYTNDGYVDLYVTNYGANQLWRNRGDGTFEDVTEKSGTGDVLWSTSAAFADLDGDGWLDLYVNNYVDWSVERNPACYATSSRRDYCGPSAFPGLGDRLFRNRGDGTFVDVTSRLLKGYQPGPSLGVVAADLSGDGRLDLYVANDGAANQLWIQQPDGTFLDDALFAGVAVNRGGSPEASMGLDAGDVDGDGDYDLILAHLMGETNTLYLGDGTGLFEDRSVETGLGAPSLGFTSFGAGFLDYDNDGWLDFLIVSGAVRILEDRALAGDPFPLDQTNQLFHNDQGRFSDVTPTAGASFGLAEVSRGVAFGDVDNDGDTDVLITNCNGRARLLRNTLGQDHPWVGLRLVEGGRDALGAEARILRQAGPTLLRRVRAGGSYLSGHDPRILVGVGEAVLEVRVTWSNGEIESWKDIPKKTYTSLAHGTGTKVP